MLKCKYISTCHGWQQTLPTENEQAFTVYTVMFTEQHSLDTRQFSEVVFTSTLWTLAHDGQAGVRITLTKLTTCSKCIPTSVQMIYTPDPNKNTQEPEQSSFSALVCTKGPHAIGFVVCCWSETHQILSPCRQHNTICDMWAKQWSKDTPSEKHTE